MTTTKQRPRVGKYIIREKLGAGGFGVVRKAVDETNGNVVAIKILDKEKLQLFDMTRQVRRELMLLTKLRHKHIVRGLEVLISKSKIFLVMEYVDGGEMFSALLQKERYDEGEAKRLFCCLIECIVYCHSKGVYHRDLKLENLLLTSSGQLKVCDFGFATVREHHGAGIELCKTAVGTEDYSCPEIMRKIPYSGERADMWSCGIILYTMLSGHYPFRGRNPEDVAKNISTCKFSIPKYFSKSAGDLIYSLLVKSPEDCISAVDVLKSEWLKTELPRSIRATGAPKRLSQEHDGSSTEKTGSYTDMSPPIKEKIAPKPLKALRGHARTVDGAHNLDIARSIHSVPNEFPTRIPQDPFTSLGRARIPNFLSLLKAMRDPDSGIVVLDRKWRWKSFPSCFIGSEATRWLSIRLSFTVADSIAFGQKLLEAGSFHHVCRDHGFKNEYLFYRWRGDDPANIFVMNEMYIHRSLNPRSIKAVIDDLLNELSTICEFHQHLHGYRQVNVLGVQQDPRFNDFLMHTMELQTAPIYNTYAEEQKISILINLHNLFWLHARILIGDFEEISFESMKEVAEEFEYKIGGSKLSLGEVTNLLMPSRSGGKKRRVDDRPMGYIERSESLPHHITRPFMKLMLGAEPTDIVVLLRPRDVNILLKVLLSDGSPGSPSIRVVDEFDLTENAILRATGEFLNKVLDVDLDSFTLRYPSQIEDFRNQMAIVDGRIFLACLLKICADFEISTKLRQMRTNVERENAEVKMIEIDEQSLPYSRTILGPKFLDGPA